MRIQYLKLMCIRKKLKGTIKFTKSEEFKSYNEQL